MGWLRSTKKNLMVWLFGLGLIAEACGFVIGNSEAFPGIADFVDPDYTAGQAGLRTLLTGQELLPEMDGFSVLACLHLADARYRGIGFFGKRAVCRVADQIVESMVPGGGAIALGPGDAGFRRPINVSVSAGNPSAWSVDQAIQSLNRARRIHLTGVAAIVFCLGIALQIAGFCHEHRQRPPPGKHESVDPG